MNCLMKCVMKSLMEIFIPIGPKSRPGLKNPKTKIFALNINKGKFRKQKFRGEGRGVKTHQTSVKSLYPDRPLLIAWETGQNVGGKVVRPALGGFGSIVSSSCGGRRGRYCNLRAWAKGRPQDPCRGRNHLEGGQGTRGSPRMSRQP